MAGAQEVLLVSMSADRAIATAAEILAALPHASTPESVHRLADRGDEVGVLGLVLDAGGWTLGQAIELRLQAVSS